jgi:hypothetical protein
MSNTLYIVFEKSPRSWMSPKIVRVCKRSPKLKADQLAVKLEINASEKMFDPPVLPLQVNENNLIRPTVATVKQA